MASGTSLMQISSLLFCASIHCDSIFYIGAQLLQVTTKPIQKLINTRIVIA